MDHHHAVRHASSSLDIYSEPLYQRPGRKQEQQTYNSEMKTAFFSKLRPTVENTTISLVFKVYLICYSLLGNVKPGKTTLTIMYH